jgi:L-gulonolactone oxidase
LRFQSVKREDSKIGQELETLVRKHDYARVNWYPTQNKYVLESFDKVPMVTSGESVSTSWTSTPDLSLLGELPTQILNASKFASCTAEFLRVNLLSGFIKAEKSPKEAPVGLSHRMLAGNCRGSAKCPWEMNLKARTIEFAFPMSEFQNWTKDVRSVLSARQACFVNGIYIRFSKASQAALGQASGYDAALVEIHIPTLKEPTLEKWGEVYDEILQMTLQKYNGRPHWGKNSTPYFLGLGSKQFPEWDNFEKFRAEADPQNIFEGSLWKQIKDSQSGKESALLSSGCALRKECICAKDDHCGPNAKCVPGGFFTEAKVCQK